MGVVIGACAKCPRAKLGSGGLKCCIALVFSTSNINNAYTLIYAAVVSMCLLVDTFPALATGMPIANLQS